MLGKITNTLIVVEYCENKRSFHLFQERSIFFSLQRYRLQSSEESLGSLRKYKLNEKKYNPIIRIAN